MFVWTDYAKLSGAIGQPGGSTDRRRPGLYFTRVSSAMLVYSSWLSLLLLLRGKSARARAHSRVLTRARASERLRYDRPQSRFTRASFWGNVIPPDDNVISPGYITPFFSPTRCSVKRRRFGRIDLDTGEILDEIVAYVTKRGPGQNGFGERWFAMAQSAAMLFATSNLGLGEFRVMLALFATLDFDNMLLVNQSDIAKLLGMKRQNVQRAIKRLIEMNALLEGPKVGINRSYQLNPNFGWKGSAKRHVDALDEYRKKRMKAARISGVLEGGEKKEQENIK